MRFDRLIKSRLPGTRSAIGVVVAAASLVLQLTPNLAPLGAVVTAAPAADGPDVASPAVGVLHLVPRQRIVDTRTGLGAAKGKLASGESVAVAVAGRGGIPADGATAVLASVASVGGTGPGTLKVWPAHLPVLGTNEVRFAGAADTRNLVTVELSPGGKVRAKMSGAASHLVIDVYGWFDASGSPGESIAKGLVGTAVAPSRLLDTRASTPIAAGATRFVQVAGKGGVPASGAAAVAANVTALDASAGGTLTAFRAGSARPKPANLVFGAGVTRSITAVTKLGEGRLAIHNGSAKPVDVLVDVDAYYRTSGLERPGLFSAMAPVRVLDTRTSLGGLKGRLAVGETIHPTLVGVGGLPETGVAAVVLDVAGVDAKGAGALSVRPHGSSKPKLAVLRFGHGRDVTNAIVAKVGTDGRIDLAATKGAPHVVLDVLGWYTKAGPAAPDVGVISDPEAGGASTCGGCFGEVVGPASRHETGDVDAVRRFWTPARRAAAEATPMPLLERPSGEGPDPDATGGASTAYANAGQPAYPIYEQGYLGLDSYAPQVGRLLFYVPSSGRYSNCSGTVVARNLVLTAAHCVVDDGGTVSTNYLFVPSQRADQAPYGNWYSNITPAYYAGYREYANPVEPGSTFYPLDYAFVVIPPQTGDIYGANYYLGDITGTFPIMWNAPGGAAWSTGYPSEGSYFDDWCAHGSDATNYCWQYYCYAPISAYVRHYEGWYEQAWGCNSSGGTSGGPVFQYVGGAWYVVSVNSNGPTLEFDYDALGNPVSRRFSKNLWGPYFNEWIYSLWSAYRVP